MDSYRIAYSDHSQYALATGKKDQERLTILNEIYNPYSAQFLENCEIQEDAKILELGCGLGLMSQVLARAVQKEGFVLATDISEEQLKIARSLLLQNNTLNLEFRQLSAFKIDELQESFDVIYARLLLVHLKNPQRLIQKMKAILKPGGKLIIEDLTSNLSLHSSPPTEGMTILHRLDQLQNELQDSDDLYFASLPQYLEKEGFNIHLLQQVQPQLDTPRKRKSISFHLSSLKDALLSADKITLAGYHTMLQKLVELEQNSAIIIHYYELGQLCAIYE